MSSKAAPDKSSGYYEAAQLMYLRQRGYDFTKEQLGEPFAGYTDFASCVAKNSDKGDPHAYCGSIKHQVEDKTSRALEGNIKIIESLGANSFKWSDVKKLKELSKGKKGKFLLVEGIHPMVTDPFNVGHGPREWTAKEIMMATRTAIGKGLNINHTVSLSPKYTHKIMDGDYNESNSTAEYAVYEEDPQILEAIKRGWITKVSMQGMPRRELTRCDSCGSEGCSCKSVPEGVVFGEDDGVAMAYVATTEFEYNGIKIPAEKPGDWNTSISIVETNSRSLPKVVLTRQTLIPKLQVVTEALGLTVEKIAAIMEALQMPELKFKKILKEDLQTFNDALASGDAVHAVSILANDLYRNMPEAKQVSPVPHPQAQGSQTGPMEPPATKSKEDDQGMGDSAVGMMPQEQPGTTDKKKQTQQGADSNQETDDAENVDGKEEPGDKIPKDKELVTLSGDTMATAKNVNKQTIPDEGVGGTGYNDNGTAKKDVVTLKDVPGIDTARIEAAVQKAVESRIGRSYDEKIRNLEDGYKNMLESNKSLLESMRNLSTQVREYQKESIHGRIRDNSVRETLDAMTPSPGNYKKLDVAEANRRMRQVDFRE